MTLHLGDADGIPVTLVPAGPRDEAAWTAAEPDANDEDRWDELSETDPDVARAGRGTLAKLEEVLS